MDTVINLVSYLFAACLCIALVIGLGALSWIFATVCEKLYIGYKTSKAVPLITVVDDTARRHIRAMRENRIANDGSASLEVEISNRSPT